MKKIFKLLTIMMISLFIVACGEKKEETKTSTDSETGETTENKDQNTSSPSSTTSSAPKVKPEAVVDKFLNRIGNQSLRSAYELVDNPNWGSYDKFSNPNTGFGAVKSVEVKNISVKSSSDKAASVNAVYQIVDKEGKSIMLNVSYGLKQVDDSWKISSYKVNSSESANIFTFSIVSASVSTFIIASTDKQNFITSIFLVVTS